ncbi:MAG TPA: sugar phosphate nucleotidyltransferase [Bacteroidota bacterium]|nr:sugar phosphate nucleotidyltransferase [Bacteroidota bacterium]
MKAGIIAAGEGTRLRADGISVPKPLVQVNGVPLIERLLNSFHRNHITEAVCIVNESSIEVKKFVEGKSFKIPVHFIVKSTPSSMHSLFELSQFLVDDRFLLTTVDSIFQDHEFSHFLKYSESRPTADGILAVTNFIDDENPLYVQMNSENRITSFKKMEQSAWVTGGLYIFSSRIFKEREYVLHRRIERLRNFLAHLLEKDYRLEGFSFSKIVDVDHLQDISKAEELLKSI